MGRNAKLRALRRALTPQPTLPTPEFQPTDAALVHYAQIRGQVGADLSDWDWLLQYGLPLVIRFSTKGDAEGAQHLLFSFIERFGLQISDAILLGKTLYPPQSATLLLYILQRTLADYEIRRAVVASKVQGSDPNPFPDDALQPIVYKGDDYFRSESPSPCAQCQRSTLWYSSYFEGMPLCSPRCADLAWESYILAETRTALKD